MRFYQVIFSIVLFLNLSTVLASTQDASCESQNFSVSVETEMKNDKSPTFGAIVKDSSGNIVGKFDGLKKTTQVTTDKRIAYTSGLGQTQFVLGDASKEIGYSLLAIENENEHSNRISEYDLKCRIFDGKVIKKNE